MSSPQSIPIRKGGDDGESSLVRSPEVASPGRLHGFLIPSPLPVKRIRTLSQ